MKTLLLILGVFSFTLSAVAQGNGNNSNWKISGNSISTGDYLGTSNAEDLVFKTNNAEGFRLNTDGKLIIGGVMPGMPIAKLTLNGNMLATGDLLANGLSVVNFVRSDKGVLLNNVFCFEGNDGNSGSTNRMWTMNGDMYIQSDNAYNFNTIFNKGNTGNVGVGTSTPQEKLDVLGNVILRNRLILPNLDPANGTEDLVFIDGNGDLKKGSGAGLGDILYEDKLCPAGDVLSPQWANGTNKIYSACPQVFVGIGTNAPNHKLDVIGFGSFSSGLKVGNAYSSQSGTQAYFEGYDNQAPSRPWINCVLSEGGQDKTVFLVQNDGSVYSTAVRVRVNDDIPIPDYVFQSDYSLRSLAEVKAYVTENCHLPNIPSEDEIRAEGLSLEEMQLKLLEKVEELTLYVIQLEEKSEDQQSQISELHSQLTKNK